MLFKIIDETNLELYLREYGIDFERWSKNNNSKNVDELKREIKSGDSVITVVNNQLLRVVEVVRINIFYENKKLHEIEQIFTNGKRRKRNYPVSLSEKKTPDESIVDCAIRGLKEELNVDIDPAILVPENNSEETKNSESYHGIKAMYKYYDFCMVMPKKYFKFEGYEVYDSKNKLTTIFSWKNWS